MLVHVGGNQAPNLYCSLPSCSERSHVGGEITMPCEAPTIRLSEPQREVLESITRRGTNPQQLVRRARIILLSDKGLTNAAISEQMGYERHQVGRWRSRWSAEAECLVAAETEEPPKAFATLIERVLSDAPRPGAPVKFTGEQVTQIVAVACEDPENSGRPVTHWTGAELANEVIKREIVVSISPRQVGRFLKSGRAETSSEPILAELGV